jgi:hypothetical protein
MNAPSGHQPHEDGDQHQPITIAARFTFGQLSCRGAQPPLAASASNHIMAPKKWRERHEMTWPLRVLSDLPGDHPDHAQHGSGLQCPDRRPVAPSRRPSSPPRGAEDRADDFASVLRANFLNALELDLLMTDF